MERQFQNFSCNLKDAWPPHDTFDALIEGTSDGVFVADPEGAIRLFNPAAEILTGRTSGEAVGLRCSQVLGCGGESPCPLEDPVRLGRTWVERVCRGTRADGRELLVRLRARTFTDRVGRTAGSIALFSECGLHESLQKRMVARERLASLGELATSLVHEVGNPVSVILGFARLLVQQQGADDGGEIRERIYREAERCRKIVDQLLDYARSASRSPHPVPVGLKNVVEETLDLLSYRLRRRGVTWEVRWALETPFVLGDPGEMKQVFLNLLLNALEMSEPGGAIRVSGERSVRRVTVGGDSLLAPVSSVVEEPRVVVRVEDEGAGPGPGDPDRFFAPFVTTKERGGGLGLTVCRRILGERGGTVRLEARREGGAVAVVDLPAYGATDFP